jgi:hypothetical protein
MAALAGYSTEDASERSKKMAGLSAPPGKQ